MKKIILLAMTILLAIVASGQEDCVRKMHEKSVSEWFYILHGGVLFKPIASFDYLTALDNLARKHQFYTMYSFTIHGIPISEDDFLGLELRKSEVESERCQYDQEWKGDSIELLQCSVYVQIPILIEGTEYMKNDTIPFDSLKGKMLKFRKEKRFFGKNRIIIETE